MVQNPKPTGMRSDLQPWPISTTLSLLSTFLSLKLVRNTTRLAARMKPDLQPWTTSTTHSLLSTVLSLQHAILKPVRSPKPTRARPNLQLWTISTTTALFLTLLSLYPILTDAACIPSTGCDTAYALYHVQPSENLTSVALKFQTSKASVLTANPRVTDGDYLAVGTPLYIPFTCECVNDQLLHLFQHVVQGSDSPYSIALFTFDNLTTESYIGVANKLQNVHFVLTGASLDIPVNCSCGDPTVAPEYGLFLTYAVVEGTGGNLTGIAAEFNVSEDVVRRFNPGVVWNEFQPTQHAFIPVADRNGNYSRFAGAKKKSSDTGVIAGAAIGGAVVLCALLAFLLYCFYVHRARKRQKLADSLLIIKSSTGNQSNSVSTSELQPQILSVSTTSRNGSIGTSTLSDYSIDRSVVFTYAELARATDNFSVDNKIGQGGFAMVFYGEIRGQKLAIKRMNLQATKEFLAELQVLTHVHHTNLVQLIGYCTTDYLFLVYEFMENGTLDHHLHSAIGAKAPLSWSSRVQIALDAARGLEYLHEHTRPSYIHRDIKSANILLDKDVHAKVADFGLTKLTETKVDGNLATISTRVVGTWGYMSPEYATFGEVSPMVDVFAFGVVLLEILSGKEAILRGSLVQETPSGTVVASEDQTRSLVRYFDPVSKAPDGRDKLPKFMDPALGDNYPPEAAWKMVQLAGACTQEAPERRPSIRKAVVALMALSSATCKWEVTPAAAASHTAPSAS